MNLLWHSDLFVGSDGTMNREVAARSVPFTASSEERSVLICIRRISGRNHLFRTLGESLVCKESVGISDAILIEDFDNDYLLFKRAASLMKQELVWRVFVIVQEGHVSNMPNTVSFGFVQVMTRAAQMPKLEIIMIRESEPIRVNPALQI
jgi:hypothetical protein